MMPRAAPKPHHIGPHVPEMKGAALLYDAYHAAALDGDADDAVEAFNRATEVVCRECEKTCPKQQSVVYGFVREGSRWRLSVCCYACSRSKPQDFATRFGITVEAARLISVKHSAAISRVRSSRRHLDCSMTLTRLMLLWRVQDGLCALSGQPMSMQPDAKSLTVATIDRIDNRIGYRDDNVQWVCWGVNKMKGDMSQALFLEWCERIAVRGLFGAGK